MTMTTGNDKVALVTGAAERIGREIALAMARRGWDVAVQFGTSAPEAEETVRHIEALGRRAAAVQCDLSDEQAVRALLTQAAARLGRISCVVNNGAGFGFGDASPFSQAVLDRDMHANLATPILLAQALHAMTPADAQSVVINILDQKPFSLDPDFLSCTLSKASLQTATVMLARALAPKLRVVGVVPGNHSEDGFATAREFVPHDVASTVCFVAESPAITGTMLVVDGGQHLTPPSAM